METGDWRYGQTGDDWPRSRAPGDGTDPDPDGGTAGLSPTSGAGFGAAATDDAADRAEGWLDDPANSWGATPSWVPQQRTGDHPTQERVLLEAEGWYRPSAAAQWGQPRHSAGVAPNDEPPPAPEPITRRARFTAAAEPVTFATPDASAPNGSAAAADQRPPSDPAIPFDRPGAEPVTRWDPYGSYRISDVGAADDDRRTGPISTPAATEDEQDRRDWSGEDPG